MALQRLRIEDGIVQYRTPVSIPRVSYDDDKAGMVIEVTGEIAISIDLTKLGLHLGSALLNKHGKASLVGGVITATVTDGPHRTGPGTPYVSANQLNV